MSTAAGRKDRFSRPSIRASRFSVVRTRQYPGSHGHLHFAVTDIVLLSFHVSLSNAKPRNCRASLAP